MTSLEVDKVVAACRDLIAGAAERVKAEKGPEHEVTVSHSSSQQSAVAMWALWLTNRESLVVEIELQQQDRLTDRERCSREQSQGDVGSQGHNEGRGHCRRHRDL